MTTMLERALKGSGDWLWGHVLFAISACTGTLNALTLFPNNDMIAWVF